MRNEGHLYCPIAPAYVNENLCPPVQTIIWGFGVRVEKMSFERFSVAMPNLLSRDCSGPVTAQPLVCEFAKK